MTEMDKAGLIKAAQLAAINSKADKSGIKVGCVLQIEAAEKGNIAVVQGTNIETHGADTVHAEVCAVSSAISKGVQIHDIKSLVLWFPKYAQPPCGCCLQFLCNFFDDKFPLICAGPDRVIETTLGECLPFAYRSK